MPLQHIGPDLWVQPTPHRVFGIETHRQIVVARLHDTGALWIHSPAVPSEELRRELATLGAVRHVIGPSRWHDECLAEFQAAYPEAEFHAAPGLAADLSRVRFDHTLSDTPHPAWAADFDQHLVRGMPRLNEIVFRHRPSRSLILADLAINVGPPGRLRERISYTLAGAWGRFTPSRACRLMMQDRAAVRRSIAHILAWDFDRIIVGHGTNITVDPHGALRRAFAFLLDGWP